MNKLLKYAYKTVYKKDPWLTPEDILKSKKPLNVGIELTNICNAKCSFCGYGKSLLNGEGVDPRRKGTAKNAVFEKLLQLYSKAGGGTLSFGAILGEPSADKRWLKLIDRARTFKNIDSVTLYTNAILMDNFGYDNIIKSGITVLNISTSIGSADIYKRLYGTDDYDRVVSNIIGLLETNKKHGNIINISLLLRVDKPYDTLYSSNDYKKIAKLIGKRKISILEKWDNYRGSVTVSNLPQGHKLNKNTEEKRLPCYALYRKLQVLYDGTIQGCSCRIEPELFCGNIKEYNTMEEAYRDPKLESIRNNWLDGGDLPNCCQECTHYIPYTSLIYSGGVKDIVKTAYKKLTTKYEPNYIDGKNIDGKNINLTNTD